MITGARAPRKRAGATLLEAIVALTLLGLIGLTGVGLVRSAAQLTEIAAAAESDLAKASNFLGAVSLWSRDELDQRLGTREQGNWLLEIQRSSPDLYLVSLLDSTGTEHILQTALFRAERSRAAN